MIDGRTADEIRATGAAWITETELARLLDEHDRLVAFLENRGFNDLDIEAIKAGPVTQEGSE